MANHSDSQETEIFVLASETLERASTNGRDRSRERKIRMVSKSDIKQSIIANSTSISSTGRNKNVDFGSEARKQPPIKPSLPSSAAVEIDSADEPLRIDPKSSKGTPCLSTCLAMCSFPIFLAEFVVQLIHFSYNSPRTMTESTRIFLGYVSCPIGFLAQLVWFANALCIRSKPIVPMRFLLISGLIFGDLAPISALLINMLYTDDCGYLAVMLSAPPWSFDILCTLGAAAAAARCAPDILGFYKSVGECASISRSRKRTFFMMTILGLLPAGLSLCLLTQLTKPNYLACMTGCSQFQFNVEKILDYPLVNITDSNSTTWSVIQIENLYKSTKTETIEGGRFLVRNKYEALMECAQIFTGQQSSMDQCKLIIRASFSNDDFQPEYNLMMTFLSDPRNQKRSCITTTLPYFTFWTPHPNFTIDQTYWGPEEKLGQRLDWICGGATASRQSIGMCRDDNKTVPDNRRLIPKVDCYRRCYSWSDDWPEEAIVREHVRAQVVVGGKKMEMRYNAKLGISCDEN